MPMLDWDAYRKDAPTATDNLNHLPYVLDPTAVTADPLQNSQLLYGKRDNPNIDQNSTGALQKVVEDAFKQFYGRDARPDDLQAWVSGAGRYGLDAAGLRAGIQEAAKTDPGGPNGTQQNAFSGGLMASPNMLPTQGGFGGGIMGGYG